MSQAIAEQTSALVSVLDESGLAPDSRAKLVEAYKPLWEAAVAEVEKAASIQVTDATQLKEMKAAREARLAIKDIRVETDKKRKGLKENVLRWQQAIDGAAKVIREFCEPHEARLEEMEKFAERAEAARRAELRKTRGEAVSQREGDPAIYPLEDMNDVQFSELCRTLEIAKTQRAEQAKADQARRDAEAKAQQEVAAAAQQEAQRLRAERDEANKKLEAERERARKAEAEARAITEKAEREAAEKAEAERKAKAAEAAAKRKAAKAPDAVKIRAIGAALLAIEMPKVSDEETAGTVRRIRNEIEALAKRVEATAKSLET